jgi:purine-binding chemotaxis protein CheW
MSTFSESTHRSLTEAGRSNEQTKAAAEFLSFRLGAEEYGIDILRVQEIRSYEEPTRIANAPHSSRAW